jgi:hypothetical protein
LRDAIPTPEQRAQFGRCGTSIFAAPGKVGIRDALLSGYTTGFETPVQIREGDYEIDFVEAFSYFGGWLASAPRARAFRPTR